MSLIGGDVRADEKAGGADDFAGRAGRLAITSDEFVFQSHSQIELARRQDISADRARRRSADANDFALERCVGSVATRDSKSPVLLKLLNHGICHENFHAWNEGFVDEGWNRNRVDVAQIIRFGGTDVIAKATAQTEAGQRCHNWIFHGVGAAVASAEAESSDGEGVALASGDSSGVLDGSGLALLLGSDEEDSDVVVSDDVEGGGGNALSKSGGKIGAEFGAGASEAAPVGFSLSAVAFFFSASFSCKG